MAQINQDFLTFQGNSVTPQFTVLGAASTITGLSTAVDISTATGNVTDIQWSARRNLNDPIVITKGKVAGGVVYTTGNNGTDGKFTVNLGSSDLAGLSGWYIHTATLLQGPGSTVVTTVAIGRMNIGQAPDWTWDAGSVGVEPLYTVRNMIGDVTQSDPQLSDQQILWAISIYSNEWLAAAECCRNLVAFYSRQVDTVQGELKTNYSQRAKTYRLMAADLEMRGMARGGVTAYTGGTSLTDKNNQVSNIDRTPPQFLIGMFDNILPETPVGHQAGAGQGLPTPSDTGSGTLDVQGGP